MRKQSFVTMIVILVVTTAVFGIMALMFNIVTSLSGSAQAAAADVIIPTVIAMNPSSAFNDLDATTVITGANFTAEISGTVVLTSPTAYLGSTALTNVTWVTSATLTATVPWGIDPGTYTLTVINPDVGTGSLTDAFTVKRGIGQWNGGDLFGGEVRQILLKPGDPSTLYAGASRVGLFRSRDAGEHWTYVSSEIAVDSGVIDPLHPNWLYAFAFDGLHRSQDEGNTWTTLMNNTWPDGRSIYNEQVYVSPHNPQVLFLSSRDDPSEVYPPNVALGLIKSTNNGASWNIVADMEGVSVQDVAFDPTDALKMALATRIGRVFQSTDGGDHWNEVLKPPLSSIKSITYNPYKPAEVWITSFVMPSLPGGGAIYKSTDAAFTSWQDVTPADGDTYDMVFINFTSADSVYTTKHHSEDGGQTWQLFGPSTGYGEIIFDPNNPQIGYIGDETYGVQKTTDGGQTWEIKSQGLSGLSCYSMEVSRADPLRVFATFWGWPGIYRSDDGANDWRYFPIADSNNVRQVREDPFDPQRVYAAADNGFYMSTDGGESWGSPSYPSSQTGGPYAMQPDPYQPGHLLVGLSTGRLYASSNYGVSWQPVTMPQDLAWITEIAFHPETPGLVYLTTGGAGVYRSTDSGTSWDRIDDPHQPDMQNALNITIATHPQPMLLVATGSWYPFRSLDGGATWERVQNSQGGVSSYMFLDGDSTHLYNASWFGLLFSSNAGDTWQPAAGVMGSLHVTTLGFGDGNAETILYAATYGGDPGSESASMSPTTQMTNRLSEKSPNMLSALFDNQIYMPMILQRWPEPLNDLVKAGIYRFVQR